MFPGSINLASRVQALESMTATPLDLLVVGAGATGCGTALDAATRGLRVAIIDKGDIAGGTSSRSSKLVHGGLRYLQQGDVGLVREALRERDLLLTTLAPHLVEPLPFVLPLRHRVWERPYVGAGLLLYDSLGGSRALPRHRHVSRKRLHQQFPGLRSTAFIGGIGFHDCRMDDSRLAVALARTAVREGAHLATYAVLEEALPDTGDGLHRVRVRDVLTGAAHVVASRAVALCVGVWAPEAAAMFTADHTVIDVTRSKGIHIRLPRSAIDGDVALIVPTERSVLFVIPSDDHWLVGTTDTEWTDGPEPPDATEADIDYLLGLLAGILVEPVRRDQVTYSFAGLRPLVRDQAMGGDTAKASREHSVARLAPGVLAVVGGKWTTYRVMARDVVDTVLAELGEAPRECRTAGIPLVGSDGIGEPGDGLAGQLLRRYGSVAGEVRSLIDEDPSLAQPLAGAPQFCRAEVVH
ncbi:MAG: glycerol-3-phosphate dehydrogenase/oxidase, partial [Actinomycetota bacterium]|nr:glycerol-3-phosphate dehydrogenase/oxidase [Actinomycetota bacterium]